MPTIRPLMIACCCLAVLSPTRLPAQDCTPDKTWNHQHSTAKAETFSTDVKGSRATRIVACRDALASGDALKVFVQFEGKRESTPLVQGKCTDTIAKWAIVRSIGAEAAPATPAVASGTYGVCKE